MTEPPAACPKATPLAPPAARAAARPRPRTRPAPAPRTRAPVLRQACRASCSRAPPSTTSAALREAWLIFIYTVRRWLQIDQSMTLASSLALQTLLSIVPFAGLILTLVGLLGKDSGRGFLDPSPAWGSPTPTAPPRITDTLYELARNVTLEHLGIVGFFGSLGGASLLFLTLEATINDIWRVKYRRSAVAKFTMFYTLATLAPLVIFFSLGRRSSPPSPTRAAQPAPAAQHQLVAFILLNKPHARHPRQLACAAIGGLAGAGLFELGKRGFALYLATITTYEGTYGALAVLPVFCVWAYVSWLIVLFSVELTCVVQHLPLVRREGYVPPKAARGRRRGRRRRAPRLPPRPRRLRPLRPPRRRPVGRTLGARFQVDAPASPASSTASSTPASSSPSPSPRPPTSPAARSTSITVLEIMRLFASRDVESARADTLTEQFTRLDASIAEIFAHTTFHDLIREARASRASRPATPSSPNSRPPRCTPPRSSA
jgi:membrane protein